MSRSGKAVRLSTNAACCKNLEKKKEKSEKSHGFSMICGFNVLTRKIKGKVFMVESVFIIPRAPVYRVIFNLKTKFFLIYMFSCTGRSACYLDETNRHVATRISEHLPSDKHSHIFKHLRVSGTCHSLCSEDCFKILDSASTRFQ